MNAHVVEEDIYAAIRLDGLSNHTATLIYAGDIGCDKETAGTQAVKVGLDGASGFLIHIRNDDPGAFLSELNGGSFTDTVSAAGYNHNLVVECAHNCPLLVLTAYLPAIVALGTLSVNRRPERRSTVD